MPAPRDRQNPMGLRTEQTKVCPFRFGHIVRSSGLRCHAASTDFVFPAPGPAPRSVPLTEPSGQTDDDADGWSLRRVRAGDDPLADIGRSPRRQGRGTDRRTAEETRRRQTPRNRRERRVRPKVRGGTGAALRHQPADRLAHRRHAPRLSGIACGFESVRE